jgi:hypothetical protein
VCVVGWGAERAGAEKKSIDRALAVHRAARPGRE